MNSPTAFDDEFDVYLKQQLEESSLPDSGFTSQLTAQMSRRRRLRRSALVGALAFATAIAAILDYGLPMPNWDFVAVAPRTIVEAIILVTVCSLAWIGTESGFRLPPRNRA